MSSDTEAQRQRALLSAIRAQASDPMPARWIAPEREAAGLAPYRGHARVLAPRVLAQAFPTVHALLGALDDEAWSRLARQLWHDHPPVEGDLNRWGAALPGWLSAHTRGVDWPWLSDVARLDWACHESTQAADATLQGDTLARLGDTEPDALLIRLMPSIHVVRSDWPVVSLRCAPDPAWRPSLAALEAECALITRPGWHPQVDVLPPAWVDWMSAMVMGDAQPRLGALLDRQAPAFDLTAWLTHALTQGWIWRVDLRSPSA